MRVPTLTNAQTGFAGIEARQASQSRLQMQLGTGLRVNSPGDDPVAAAQAELARSRLAHVAQDQRAAQLATSLLSAADGALTDGIGVLQSVREGLVAAGDGSYNAEDRKALALQLRSARDAMVAMANTRDGAGGYVFAGQGATDAPLTEGTSPSLNGTAGVQRIGEGGRFAATVDGRASFMALPQGNGVFTTASNSSNTGTGWIDPGSVSSPAQLTGHDYRITVSGTAGNLTYGVQDLTAGTTLSSGVAFTAGTAITLDGQSVKISGTPAPGDSFAIAPSSQQSIFKTLDDAIATLEGTDTSAGYSEKLERVQTTLDRALEGMTLMRSRVGEEMRGVDSAVNANDQQKLLVTQRRSALEDLDYAEALSTYQSNQTGLEAALKTYATFAKTSLFDMLR